MARLIVLANDGDDSANRGAEPTGFAFSKSWPALRKLLKKLKATDKMLGCQIFPACIKLSAS